jgi:NTP pyrophosphatase (non-canonical NTP hydrolase)
MMTPSKLTLEQYQQGTAETAIYPAEQGTNYCILGLVGEAGELANKYKKVIRDFGGVLQPEHKQALQDELGDVLWYVSQLATELDLNLGACATKNLDKLASRKARNQLRGSGDTR